MTCCLILPCAGSGERFGKPAKQLQLIHGVPVFIHSLRPFISKVEAIIIPCQPALRPDIEAILRRHEIVATCIDGGETRLHSVYLALCHCPEDCTSVLIHDAVRPCISEAIIDNCIATLSDNDAVVCAIPCTDTLKRSSDSGRHSIKTLDRSGIYQAQTPQGFKRQKLLPAYAAALEQQQSYTDDASLCEHIGIQPVLIRGSHRNIKITYADDLSLAAALLTP